METKHIRALFTAVLAILISAFPNNYVLSIKGSCQKCTIKNDHLTEHLTFDELITLSGTDSPDYKLKNKVSYILHNPIVNNTFSTNTDKLNNDELLGDYLRVACWNISRGYNLERIKLIFNNPDELLANTKSKEVDLEKVKKQIEILRKSNIIVLNEVDIGMPRTKYKNVVKDIAGNLGFNYAYGVEFLEVDPTHLGLESYEWSEENLLFPDEEFVVDKEKYKGFHGNAILSQYPINNVRIIRLPSYYDWFNNEKDKISEAEIVRRKAADLVFEENVFREIRQGSRMALLADLKIPGIEKPLTVVSVHLENRVPPEYRHKQIKELLKYIKEIENPVILAGDFNTTATDGAPVSITRIVKKRVKDPHFIGRQILYSLNPLGPAVSIANMAGHLARTYKNPTVISIPIVSPNLERKFFREIQRFSFSDNQKFDLKGEEYRVINSRDGSYAASNQRGFKGFVPTFVFKRDFKIIGRYKLDWIFVKPLKAESDNEEISLLKPFFGRTLFDLNYAFEPSISDHVPITVDLPINPPSKNEVKKYLKANKLKKFIY